VRNDKDLKEEVNRILDVSLSAEIVQHIRGDVKWKIVQWVLITI